MGLCVASQLVSFLVIDRMFALDIPVVIKSEI